MSSDFLKEKTNPGGYGSLTALSGKETNFFISPPGF